MKKVLTTQISFCKFNNLTSNISYQLDFDKMLQKYNTQYLDEKRTMGEREKKFFHPH